MRIPRWGRQKGSTGLFTWERNKKEKDRGWDVW